MKYAAIRKQVPEPWQPTIADYRTHLMAAGQRPKTIELRKQLLQRVARALGGRPEEITAQQLVEWFGSQTHWQPATRKTYRDTLRSFLTWGYEAGRIPVYLANAVPGGRLPKAPPKPVPEKALQAALAAADKRVALAIRLAAEAGLRRAEVAGLHADDLTEDAAGYALHIRGKGGHQRVVPISDDLAEHVTQAAAGWLFPNGRGGPLSPVHLGNIVAAVLPRGYTMHKLRHRYATRVYRNSGNLRAVQQLLGHASIATTEQYLAIGDDEVRAAALAATG